MQQKNTDTLLYAPITYQIRGACVAVRNALGKNHKEIIYHRALIEEFKNREMNFTHEPRIDIYYPGSGKKIGTYQPDFLIDDKILMEIKSVFPLPTQFISQSYDYVKNSKYELILFVNFGGPRLYIKRLIFTNDRKPFLSVSNP